MVRKNNLKSWYKLFRKDLLYLLNLVEGFRNTYDFKWKNNKKIIYSKFVKFLYSLSDKQSDILNSRSIIIGKKHMRQSTEKLFDEYYYNCIDNYNIFLDNYQDIIADLYCDMKNYCNYQANRILSKSNSSYDIELFLFLNLIV